MKELIEVHRYLPHKHPMLMVDGIREISEEGVECQFNIPEDCVFLDNGMLTESGLIENAAQTASCIVAQSYFIDQLEKNVIGFISSIRSIRLLGQPLVGDTLVTRAVLISRFDAENYITCRVLCKTYREEMLLLEGEINLFIQEQNHEKGRSTPG